MPTTRRFASVVILFSFAACSDAPLPTGTTALPQPRALAAVQGAGNSSDLIPDEYIVVYKHDVSDAPGHTRRLIAREKASLQRSYSHALRGYAAKMSAAAAENVRRDPAVAYVEQSQILRAAGTQTSAPWGLDRIDQRKPRLDQSYGYAATGAGVTIYIIDSGIDYGHAEFGGRASSLGDFAYDANGGIDCNGHGTHVAGIAGGATFGVAKGVTLKSVRVLSCGGDATLQSVIAGIDAVTADHQPGQPAVVNMSIEAHAPIQSVFDAMTASIDEGVTYVVAAGNGGLDVFGTPIQVNACGWTPGGLPAAITVGAIDGDDREAVYPGFGASNYGPCVDLLAPGVAVRSAKLGGGEKLLDGTSQAAPHVAGAAARYLQNYPNASPAQVAKFLTNTATADAIRLIDKSLKTPNRLLFMGATQ